MPCVCKDEIGRDPPENGPGRCAAQTTPGAPQLPKPVGSDHRLPEMILLPVSPPNGRALIFMLKKDDKEYL